MIVVITGACSGIGVALSHVFYEHGCKLILVSDRRFALERLKQDLISKRKVYNPEPLVFELNGSSFANFIYRLKATCGNIDILIDNGCVSLNASVLPTKLQVYKEIMELQYHPVVGLKLAASTKMVRRKSGHLACSIIYHVQGLIALPEHSASKHALQQFGDSLRTEMKQHNVIVSMISLGYIKPLGAINSFNRAPLFS